jgi:hypothetical protein
MEENICKRKSILQVGLFSLAVLEKTFAIGAPNSSLGLVLFLCFAVLGGV